eukprot:jgi/Psemu1/49418/gm1.49418_g
MPPPPSSESSPALVPKAGILSVTVVHEPSRSYGVQLAAARSSKNKNKNKNKSSSIVDETERSTDLVIERISHPPHGLLEGSPLERGDIIKTINNRPARTVLNEDPIDDGRWELDWGNSETFREQAPVTFVVEKPPSATDNNNNNNNNNNDSGEDDHDDHDDHDDDECRSAVVRAVCLLPAVIPRPARARTRTRTRTRTRDGPNNSIPDKALLRSEWLKTIGLEFHRVVVEEHGVETDGTAHVDSDTASNGKSSNDSKHNSYLIHETEEALEDPSADDDNDNDNDNDNDVVSSNVSVAVSIGSADVGSTEPQSGASTLTSPSPSGLSYLQIDKIDPHGLLAHSVLNQGDIVLAINGIPVCATPDTPTVERANDLLLRRTTGEQETNSTTTTTTGTMIVDIVALNPRKLVEVRQRQTPTLDKRQRQRLGLRRRQWMRAKVKKASVALGGGAMIGVGLVVHPLGGILLASGVSVLGTEFEAPNRMVKSARDSFAQWANSSGSDKPNNYNKYKYTYKYTRSSNSNSNNSNSNNSNSNSNSNNYSDEEEEVVFSSSTTDSIALGDNNDGGSQRLGSYGAPTTKKFPSPTVSDEEGYYQAPARSHSRGLVVSLASTDDPSSPTTAAAAAAAATAKSTRSSRRQRAADNAKRIGKRFVLPFLDRLAGDRKNIPARAGPSTTRGDFRPRLQDRDDEDEEEDTTATAVAGGPGVDSRQQSPVKHE